MDSEVMTPKAATPFKPKFHWLSEKLKKSILDGQYKHMQMFPTEIELADHYSLSRPTVARALDLLRKEGLIVRKSGVGTFVHYQPWASVNNFGLLVPGIADTEVFETICCHLSRLAQMKNFNLIWNSAMQEDAAARHEHLENLAARYIAQGINGVFFAPLERTSEKDPVNRSVVRLFDQANIPVVLLDRDIVSFPDRSRYDVVGVDNFRLGFVVTRHLIEQGCRSIKFVARSGSAPTTQMRIFGCLQALRDADLPSTPGDIHIREDFGPGFIDRLLNNVDRPGIFCANDSTASHLMLALAEAGFRIPDQVKIAGVDDIKYANYLRVPLTTYNLPCGDIANTAVSLMLSRIAAPGQRARTVQLEGKLVPRKSTGASFAA